MKKILVALAATSLTSPSYAQEEEPTWGYLATVSSGTQVFVRMEDYQRGRSYMHDARVWVRYDHSRDRQVEWRTTLALYSIDCPQRTIQLIESVAVWPNGHGERAGGDRRVNIIPETLHDLIADNVCSDPDDERISRT